MNMASLSPVCNPFLSFDRSLMETLDLILNLTKAKGFCFARNEWLAEQLGVKSVTISRRVSQLVKAGLLFWQRVGKRRHLFPAFPVPADGKSPSEAIEQMIRQRYAKSKPPPKTHVYATNQQTEETKETFRENTQQTAAAPESSFASLSPVVASSAKAFPEEEAQTERSASDFAPIASLLQAFPEPPAESAGQGRGESPGAESQETAQARAELPAAAPEGTRPPSPVAALPETAPALATPEAAAVPEVKPDSAAPVADVEIVSALHQCAGMGLRAAQLWAAKQPAECRRLLAALGEVSGVRNKAAWIVAALRDTEAGTPYAFATPPAPKAPPKAAQEGETERKAQKRLADVEASEKAAEAQYEAIPKAERERLEAQIMPELPKKTRESWKSGGFLGKQAVRAAVVTRWRQEAANVSAS